MSEQRGVRGGSSDGSNDPEDTDATESEAAGSKADLSKADLSKADVSKSDAPSSRPTGKRRARSAASADSSDTGDSGKGVATATRVANRTRKEAAPKQNVFKRLRRFFREVVAELRKVIWPNRKQMITYTVVVVVFVTFMVAFISGLDLAFIKGVTWLFG